MAVRSVHPHYTAMLSKWELGRDSYEGEDAIKAKGEQYLPPTSGQRADGYPTVNTAGANSYEAMKRRALYPDIYKEAVEAAIGIMHRKPPEIALPKQMEDMLSNCTLLGESMEMLLRRINARQLITGRLGILADIRVDRATKQARPVIITYNDVSIRNWNDSADEQDDIDVSVVVLNESGYVMGADLEWTENESYRVLALADKTTGIYDTETGVYGYAILNGDQTLLGAQFEFPNIQGKVCEEIPFCFINSKDLATTPDRPPLDGLAKLCLAIYRGEADYRQNLFMQGQDTLVRVGYMQDPNSKEDVRVGAGAVIDVPQGGDAKYIGVSSNGLPEQRQALENDYKRAVMKSGQLADATSRAKESGDALRIRIAAQTATLPQIAMAGAAGLEKVLKVLATWMGANPNDVHVVPNMEFTEADLNGQTIVQIVQAKTLGAPISDKSIHNYMREHGLTELDYEKELAEIEGEAPRI